MTIQPWRATCIQTRSKLAVKAADRAGAWAIINENIAHVSGLIDVATRGSDPPRLVVLPEFSLQGPPHGLPRNGSRRPAARIPVRSPSRCRSLPASAASTSRPISSRAIRNGRAAISAPAS